MNIDMIRAAQDRLSGHARRTPLLRAPGLDRLAGRRVFVKAECLQHTGSFKFRGGWSAVTGLEPKNGVIAYSSGNHAQGVAAAAAAHDLTAVIVMPENAPALKLANTRNLGAEVVTYDRATQSREEIGEALAAERDLTLVRPYDEPFVIAGQGTVGLELAEQLRAEGVKQAEVLVPCGGGGLTSGIALALQAEAPSFRVRTVEPAGFDDVARSLRTGIRQSNPEPEGSICDAIVTSSPGELTFPIMHSLCGPGLVVSDEASLRAMADAFRFLKIVVEPGGAVALAAAIEQGGALEGDAVAVVASGGNVDPATFSKALELMRD